MAHAPHAPQNHGTNGAFSRLSTWLTSAAAAISLLALLIAFFVKIANLETTVVALQIRADRNEAAFEAGTLRGNKTREDIISLQQNLSEIETLFCAEGNIRAQIHTYDLRFFGLLWRKVYGEELPLGTPFHAIIGRCTSLPR